ncbi:hypothetical protein BOTBODRAFT_302940 [Botryobasidium botryosum FD-172 SS1]|uniref:Uncharacterized protein n=1 Tax=Botryobasidium botryosum (strain FD-172 SS1) TaxID=930990 RepID=A0A067MU61_BOTB1|nr:hypothetical protein BOTBODRAFT_302940 [Botryobasidium botryosum FD-172 SS1]
MRKVHFQLYSSLWHNGHVGIWRVDDRSSACHIIPSFLIHACVLCGAHLLCLLFKADFRTGTIGRACLSSPRHPRDLRFVLLSEIKPFHKSGFTSRVCKPGGTHIFTAFIPFGFRKRAVTGYSLISSPLFMPSCVFISLRKPFCQGHLWWANSGIIILLDVLKLYPPFFQFLGDGPMERYESAAILPRIGLRNMAWARLYTRLRGSQYTRLYSDNLPQPASIDVSKRGLRVPMNATSMPTVCTVHGDAAGDTLSSQHTA